jgi:hypothetical protein
MPSEQTTDYQARIEALQAEINQLRDRVLPSLYEIRNMLLNPPEPRQADVDRMAARTKKIGR